MDRLYDLPGLERCGIASFCCDKPGPQERFDANPRVVYQEALARRAGRLVDAVVQQRCGSLDCWTSYYPFKLLGLTSCNPAVVLRTPQEFREDVEAFWAAQEPFEREGYPFRRPFISEVVA